MIRFSCPGCQAVYTVGPDKAGKTGKCPKCQSQFSIPKEDGAGMTGPAPTTTAPDPAPAPSPAADPDAPVEIAPCPSCGTALTVATQYLGADVECPTCKNVFTAKMPGESKASSKTSTALAKGDEPDEDEDRPSRKSKRAVLGDEDDEDRPAKKSKRRDDDDDEDDRPSKKSKGRDDDEDDAPRKKKKKRRSTSGIDCKKSTAGILGILLGGWGVHKFYLGYSTAGIIQIVITLVTCGLGALIGTIEGIIYLTKTDEDFIETYQIGQKEWF